MHLKRLELIGFKSFASKTVLDFPSGITAIVGPNGSGKSNVIDAVRWLLGERDAKNIRGAKVEDLIFAGTTQRARVGMAQATIVFDNSKRFFPVDFEEVAVTRRVSRDGTTEYLINNAPVRLKDIVDFFAKARLGTKGLTIVNQGNSDIFVRASPKERRVMIEEVLGLRQYQLKKHDAELKIQNTRINLDKAKALIEEIAPHLRLLRRQAARWEKQSEIEKELHDLEDQYFLGKLKLIERDFKELVPQEAALDKSLAERRAELKILQAKLTEVEKSGPRGDKDYQDFKKKQSEFLNQKSEIQKQLGRLEAQLEYLTNQPKAELKATEAAKALSDVRIELEKALVENDFLVIKNMIKSLIVKLNDLLSGDFGERDSRLKELEKSRHDLASKLATLEKELAELNSFENKLAENLREFNAVFRKAFEAVEAKKDEITELDNKKNKLAFEKERVAIRQQELENLAAQNNRRLSEFESQLDKSNSAVILDFSELERRMFKLRAEIAGIGELDPTLIKEAQETESRHNFLSKQSEDLEKASADFDKLIKELDEKIHHEFTKALKEINEQFNEFFKAMFGGGRASLKLQKPELRNEKLSDEEVTTENAFTESAEGVDEDKKHAIDHGGIEVDVSIPRKKISGLDMLSGGELALVSVAALFAFISVSPPPFLVLDEVDAPLDEKNTRRFANLIKDFAKKTQFILVTHNRATMEAANILYGITMGDDGTSRVLSLKLESEEAARQ